MLVLAQGDFDPEAFDRRMAEIYNDDYYNQADDGFQLTGAEDGLPPGVWQEGEGGGAEGPEGKGFDALTKELQQSKNKKARRRRLAAAWPLPPPPPPRPPTASPPSPPPTPPPPPPR